jgi:hypothetical protein
LAGEYPVITAAGSVHGEDQVRRTETTVGEKLLVYDI